jgi:hypothetical protein
MGPENLSIKDEFENWCTDGPLLELSIVSFIGNPKEPFINSILRKTSTKFTGIEIVEEEGSIKNNIRLFCNGEIESMCIKIFVKIGFKRRGYIFFEMLDKSLLHTEVYFADDAGDDENGKYREEVKNLWDKLIKKLNGFCGTVGLETNVKDLFKIENLIENYCYTGNYGIENVYWKST